MKHFAIGSSVNSCMVEFIAGCSLKQSKSDSSATLLKLHKIWRPLKQMARG